MTAFEQAKKWGIVPRYQPGSIQDPGDRKKMEETYRAALEKMRVEYKKRASMLLLLPTPGPRPPEYVGAPPFPEAHPDPTTPDEIRIEEERISAYNKKNNEWLDSVFFPGEAERVIWEAACEIFEERERDRRAQASLRWSNFKSVAPAIAKIAVGVAALAAAFYVAWEFWL